MVVVRGLIAVVDILSVVMMFSSSVDVSDAVDVSSGSKAVLDISSVVNGRASEVPCCGSVLGAVLVGVEVVRTIVVERVGTVVIESVVLGGVVAIVDSPGARESKNHGDIEDNVACFLHCNQNNQLEFE